MTSTLDRSHRRAGTTPPLTGTAGSTRRLTRWLVTTPQLAVLAAVAAAAVGAARGGGVDVLRTGLSPGVTVAGVVLVTSLVLGLPHGAVDLARLEGSRRERAPVAGLYLVLTGLTALAWLLDPVVTLLGLLALSLAHFGAADLELHDVVGDAPRHRFVRVAGVVAGGGVPVVVPLGLHGGAVRGVVDGLTAGHGTVVVGVCRDVLPLLAVAVLVVVVDAARRGRWGPVADLAVLLVLFVAVSPLLAFAAYFGLWHAWRQTGLMLDRDARVRQVSLSAASGRLLRQAAAPSLLSVAAVACLVIVGDRAVLVWGLAAVLCLTVPHAVLASGVVAPSGARVVRRSTSRRRPRRFGSES